MALVTALASGMHEARSACSLIQAGMLLLAQDGLPLTAANTAARAFVRCSMACSACWVASELVPMLVAQQQVTELRSTAEQRPQSAWYSALIRVHQTHVACPSSSAQGHN